MKNRRQRPFNRHQARLIPALVDHRYSWGLAMWVTTSLSRERMAAVYGDAVARRVYERASVVVVP